MRVKIIEVDGHEPGEYDRGPKLWVDCAYWFSKGELAYIRQAR